MSDPALVSLARRLGNPLARATVTDAELLEKLAQFRALVSTLKAQIPTH